MTIQKIGKALYICGDHPISKAGYCIVDRDVLEIIYSTIKTCLEKDSK